MRLERPYILVHLPQVKHLLQNTCTYKRVIDTALPDKVAGIYIEDQLSCYSHVGLAILILTTYSSAFVSPVMASPSLTILHKPSPILSKLP